MPYNYETRLFEDPNEAVQQLKREIISDVAARYAAEKAPETRARFREQVKKLAPGVRDEDIEAQMHLEIADGWADAPTSAMPAFAKHVANQLRDSGSGSRRGTHPLDSTTGSAYPGRPDWRETQSSDEGEDDSSLSGIIKGIQKRQREAHTNNGLGMRGRAE